MGILVVAFAGHLIVISIRVLGMHDLSDLGIILTQTPEIHAAGKLLFHV